MFIKELVIRNRAQIIRDIHFKSGLNLIVDDTDRNLLSKTGNGVGKTTVLKIIDYCFGGELSNLYTMQDSGNPINNSVKEFFENNDIIFELSLADNIIAPSKTVKILRNCKKRNDHILKINGVDCKKNEVDNELKKIFYPQIDSEKPTFRQLISRNIRLDENAISKTINYLNPYTTSEEYQSIYLFMFGMPDKNASDLQKINDELKQEINFKRKLENKETVEGYTSILSSLKADLNELEGQTIFSINENFESDFEKLKAIKEEVSYLTSTISSLEMRTNLLNKSLENINSEIVNIDSKKLFDLYNETTKLVGKIGKDFDELVNFHNAMVNNKKDYVEQQKIVLEEKARKLRFTLKNKLEEDKKLTDLLNMTISADKYKEINEKIFSLNRRIGEISSKIADINECNSKIKLYKEKIQLISSQDSDEFKNVLQEKIDKFNTHFKAISKMLYNEEYLLKFSIKENKKTKTKFFQFISFNPAYSTGKKQGEILAFDLAYNLFADDESVNHLSFILNDKKELMSINQLINLSNYLESESRSQVVFSILRDKLTDDIASENIILSLKEDDKLFRF